MLNTAGGHQGYFIFVMDGDGNIYTADKRVVRYHSSFLAGGPVAAAGAWSAVCGAVTNVGNASGH